MIAITAKKDGFRRCGRAHTTSTTEYKNDAFTEKQLAELQAEPMLVVVVTEDVVEETKDSKPETKGGKKAADPDGK